jgi:hypothetical protein
MKITAAMSAQPKSGYTRPSEYGLHFTQEFDIKTGTFLSRFHIPNATDAKDISKVYGKPKTLADLRLQVINGYHKQILIDSKGKAIKPINFLSGEYDTKDLVLAKFRPGTDAEIEAGKKIWAELPENNGGKDATYATKTTKELEAWLNG